MGCVHIRCLEQWLNVSSQNFCELCSYRFEVVQVRRYSLLKSIRVWVCQDHGSLYKAIFFIVLSATNSFLLSWMWFLWLSNVPSDFIRGDKVGQKDVPHQDSHDVSRPKWMAVFVFLTLLTLFSIKSLCFDGYKAVRSQYHAWYRWWNETCNIQLVLDLENYKIKNKLEESQAISLKYTRDKAFTPNPNDTNYKTVDFSLDFPEIHKTKDIVSESVSDHCTLIPDEIIITDILENSNDDHECVKQEKTTSSEKITISAKPVDMLYESGKQNQSSEDIPKVHKQPNIERE